MVYFIGVDIGTSSLKVLLGNTLGEVLGAENSCYPVDSYNENYSEQDPQLWIEAFNKSLKKLLNKHSYLKNEDLIISFTGQMHTLVLIDSKGNPLRPAILWNDGRTDEEVKILNKEYLDHLINTEKNIPLDGFTLPKLLWVKINEPNIWKNVYKFMMPKDYLIYYLTGNIYTEQSDASGTIMYDIIKKRWDSILLRDLDINENICPEVLTSFDKAGELKKSIKSRFELTGNIQIIMGGADNACGAFGSIDDKENQALISVGTSGVVLYYDTKKNLENIGKYHYFNSIDENYNYKMGVTLSAGYSLNWFKNILLPESTYEDFTKLAEESYIGSNDLQFHPYLFGERSPFFNPSMSGAFKNIKSYHTRNDFVRSVMEGITFSLKHVYENMIDNYEVFRVIGGITKNNFWLQMFSDIFDSKIQILEWDEGPAYGALLCGVLYLENATCISNWRNSNSIKREFIPCKKNVIKYKSYYENFKKSTIQLSLD